MSRRASGRRHGRQNASSSSADSPMRSAVMPSTPTTGNRLLAIAAPRFCDTSDAASATSGSAPAPRAAALTQSDSSTP